MQFPTVSNDVLPANMIAFSMPVKAGEDGTMQFRYDTKSKRLFCDLKGEDNDGMPAQFDNVVIHEGSTIPELMTIWELTSARRAMYDAEYLESQGFDAPVQDVSEANALTQSSVLPDPPAQANESPLFDQIAKPTPQQQETPISAAPSHDVYVGELFTKEQMNAKTQRENDRMVLRTLHAAFLQVADPKDNMIPIIDALVNTNEEMYQRNFGEVYDDGDD